MKTLLNIQDMQQKVSALGSQYGAERIFLFGSYARGDTDEESDIDLRIDHGQITVCALGGLLLDLEASLNKNVDLLTTGSLDITFLDAIKDEEILLYERES